MVMTDYDGFRLEKDGGVGTLTFVRPEKLNAFTVRMAFVDLPRVFRKIRNDDEIRVLIITGAGKAFCSGFDLSEMSIVTGKFPEEWTATEKLQLFGHFALELYEVEKPVIAAVNGVAAGAGLSIAMCCDLRIASERARFAMNFANRGLIPDSGATLLMPRLIGTAKTLELMYTGDAIDAKDAENIGLVNKVVSEDKLMQEVRVIAQRLAKGAPLAMAQLKRAVQNGLTCNLQQQLLFESNAQRFCFNTQDFEEGVKAFLEKREPQFKGK